MPLFRGAIRSSFILLALVLRASWGRFMHPSALVLPSYARANITPRLYYFSCSRYSRFFLGVAPERCMEASPGERVVVNRTVPNWIADPHSEPRGSAEANENHPLDLQAAKGFRLGGGSAQPPWLTALR